MLVDKYRPQRFDDVIGQEDIVKALRQYVLKGQLPHMVLMGRAGVGKTTMVRVLANEIFGDSKYMFFEINASKDNGIQFLRDNITQWAKLAIPAKHRGKHRIIFLDEADHLTGAAQAALKRLIEDNSKSCRFILACNNPEKITDPIYSRCQSFLFTEIPKDIIQDRLISLGKLEGFALTPEVAKTITKLSSGDMRRSVRMLEHYITTGMVTDIPDRILNTTYEQMMELSYNLPSDVMFQIMYDELIMGYESKQVDIRSSVLILAEHEYRASHSTMKFLQVQAAYINIRKALASGA